MDPLENLVNSKPDKKPESRRSFLPAPKSYSKPTFSEDQVPKTQPIPIPISPTNKVTQEECETEASEFVVGDRVCISGVKTGTLLYFGSFHLAEGLWCGIALDEPDGNHDGLVKDFRYFTCRKGHGIFAPVDKVSNIHAKKKQNTAELIASPPSQVSVLSYRKVDSIPQKQLHEFEKEPDETETLHSILERKLQTVPKRNLSRQGYGVSRSKTDGSFIEEEIEEIAEELDKDSPSKRIGDKEGFNRTYNLGNEIYGSPEHAVSLGGSSGGDDSWSLSSKPCLVGNVKQYMNITFDSEGQESKEGESTESKESNIVETEESPSPEFIFDQEMIEDGEFDTENIQILTEAQLIAHGLEISHDSSLGLLSSFMLEKTNDILELVEYETDENNSRQEDMEELGNKNKSLNAAVNFLDFESSTPIITKTQSVTHNDTYILNDQNDTYTVGDEMDQLKCMSKLDSTFTMDGQTENKEQDIAVILHDKVDLLKGPMVDSGISLKGSMTDSQASSMTESVTSLCNSVVDSLPSMRGSMLDSGISVPGIMVESGVSLKGDSEDIPNLEEEQVKMRVHICQEEQKLITDLEDGHNKKVRPLSLISVASADTGYVPDTDSEMGTLTLNSPQDWTEKGGFHGNYEMSTVPESQIENFQQDSEKNSLPAEMDSDVGTLMGDTDTETDRTEAPKSVSPGETIIMSIKLKEDSCGNKTLDSTGVDQIQNFSFSCHENDSEEIKQVTIVIADKEDGKEIIKEGSKAVDKKVEKLKDSEKTTPRSQRKPSLPAEFKKPNINVGSRLADYIKAPLPTKPKEDQANTEEAKNKRNTQKSKGDSPKHLSRTESTEVVEKKQEVIEKEPVKKVKRTPPKSKWETIMSQIEHGKSSEKNKPKEVKSKLEAYLNAPIPVSPRKIDELKDEPKVKKKIPASKIPDFSKVQSKLKITAPPPRVHKDDSSSDRKESSPSRSRRDSKESSTRSRHQSGNSMRRYSEIQPSGIHIDLVEALNGVNGSGNSIESSARSSYTDLSTTGTGDETKEKNSKLALADKQTSCTTSEQKDSSAGVLSDTSQSRDTEDKKKVLADSKSRKSSIPPPVNYQNRNKKEGKNKSSNKSDLGTADIKELHNKEIQRLEALCESRTKQLNMMKLQLQSSNTAFDAMSVLVGYLSHDLDAFSCPQLLEQVKKQLTQIEQQKIQIESLEEKKIAAEADIQKIREQHAEEMNCLKLNHEIAINIQREDLTKEHSQNMQKVEETRDIEIKGMTLSHETQMSEQKKEHEALVEKLKADHGEEIKNLQIKQENQMEELHKQHQDKLEDITNRFEGIKQTLSEKVQTLKEECEQLRNHATNCEDALQKDSDIKVQAAIAPYRNLPKEIEGLRMVIEMRNDEIQKLRKQNMALEKQLEELPAAKEKIISLQQKVENLQAIVNLKTDHEKQLHEKCQNLMRKYDKESRAKKRLSMDYEELMWKVSQTPEFGSDENLYLKRLEESSNGDVRSPEVTRRLRSPTKSEASRSPAKSPVQHRATHSVGDEPDRKLKHRSATVLVDEKGTRSASPLTRESPLTRSWSPSQTYGASVDVSPERMSQSWHESEVFEKQNKETSMKSQENPTKTQDIVDNLVQPRSKLVTDEDIQVGDKISHPSEKKSVSVLSSRLKAEEHLTDLRKSAEQINGSDVDCMVNVSSQNIIPDSSVQKRELVNPVPLSQNPSSSSPQTNSEVKKDISNPTQEISKQTCVTQNVDSSTEKASAQMHIEQAPSKLRPPQIHASLLPKRTSESEENRHRRSAASLVAKGVRESAV
ncbi:hypothetical protein ACJMK2_032343 [Sinanodonta woodiana]|uniref:CAP-Gly domain-containing protein n=1 Tax=Sinanodonta woodiana TaxID=1069815 RepID=A0ABD3X1F2_SINWO